MHGFDTTIQLVTLRQDELRRSAPRRRCAGTAGPTRTVPGDLVRRVRQRLFPASAGRAV